MISTTDEIFWIAVSKRDGVFWYSVAATGVYCYPSCTARLANRKNVGFHCSCAAAMAAGFRPCKRCKPNVPPRAIRHAAMAAEARRLIETAEECPDLEIMSRGSGVTSSRGMDDFRAGGATRTLTFGVGEFSLGHILVAISGKGVCAVLLGNDPEELTRDLRDRFPRAQLVGGHRAFQQVVAQVIVAVEAGGGELDVPLDIRGTAFQHRVWTALRAIPAGSTVSYAQISSMIGQPSATRAVAGACAANPLAIVVPCHRVVRNDGGLSGYRWGVERKRALLEREARA